MDSTKVTFNFIDMYVNFENNSIGIEIGYVLLLILLGLFGILLFRKKFPEFSTFEVTSLEVSIGNITAKVEHNYTNIEIAHRIYIELVTRKAALPIDEDKDFIIEIYSSWYNLFKITRDEIKSISGKFLKKEKDGLANLAIEVLNGKLRNHLTKYQSIFKKWYITESEKKSNIGKSPIDIQKIFYINDEMNFQNLIKDMKEVNAELKQYSEQLKKFIRGELKEKR